MGTAPHTLALERCPVCRATGGEDFTVGEAELRRCGSCGAVYAQRYADPDAVYQDGYYTDDSPFGIDIRHPRFQAFLREVNAQRADRLLATVGPVESLLDVGCGSGDFLEAVQQRGVRAVGVEPIEESVRWARERGVEVIQSTLEDSGLPERSFDVVCVLHVLEHMPDGPEFLSMIARWARPGGHVLVEVPSWGSRLRRVSGDRYVHLRPLEHLVHHTPATIEDVLRRAGLEPVTIETPTWESALQMPAEALADLGRSGWNRLPKPLLGPVIRAARSWDERNRQGMVVWALARVP